MRDFSGEGDRKGARGRPLKLTVSVCSMGDYAVFVFGWNLYIGQHGEACNISILWCILLFVYSLKDVHAHLFLFVYSLKDMQYACTLFFICLFIKGGCSMVPTLHFGGTYPHLTPIKI